MWAEGGTTGARNGEVRINEALSLGASVISTSCPFCLLTLEDAVKISGRADQVVIKDISELVAEAIDDANSNGRHSRGNGTLENQRLDSGSSPE